MLALPAGHTGIAAVVVLLIAALDVVIGVALYPVLAPGGTLMAQLAAAMRVAYGALFAVAAGSLIDPVDTAHFHAVWDIGLMIFGLHLVLVGLAVVRAPAIPAWIGVLVVVAGVGYLADSTLVALSPGTSTSFAEVTFIGEVILLIWLIGWGGKVREPRPALVPRDQP